MGPSESAGKKVRPPTMITTATTHITKSGVWVGSVPRSPGSTSFSPETRNGQDGDLY